MTVPWSPHSTKWMVCPIWAILLQIPSSKQILNDLLLDLCCTLPANVRLFAVCCYQEVKWHESALSELQQLLLNKTIKRFFLLIICLVSISYIFPLSFFFLSRLAGVWKVVVYKLEFGEFGKLYMFGWSLVEWDVISSWLLSWFCFQVFFALGYWWLGLP